MKVIYLHVREFELKLFLRLRCCKSVELAKPFGKGLAGS